MCTVTTLLFLRNACLVCNIVFQGLLFPANQADDEASICHFQLSNLLFTKQNCDTTPFAL
jgi:hypothetical protein